LIYLLSFSGISALYENAAFMFKRDILGKLAASLVTLRPETAIFLRAQTYACYHKNHPLCFGFRLTSSPWTAPVFQQMISESNADFINISITRH